jgi:hypothetical protein
MGEMVGPVFVSLREFVHIDDGLAPLGEDRPEKLSRQRERAKG